MSFPYFYGRAAEQYAFYRIPKLLFSDERFEALSTDAKLLYGMLIDRMELSMKNGWTDKDGRVFIYFTLEDARERLKCVPFPVSWTVKMKKKQKETQDILSYHTQAAGCSDKARAKGDPEDASQ